MASVCKNKAVAGITAAKANVELSVIPSALRRLRGALNLSAAEAELQGCGHAVRVEYKAQAIPLRAQ